MRRHNANALERDFKQLVKETVLSRSAAKETSPQIIDLSLPAGDEIIHPKPSLCLHTCSLLKLQALIYWKVAMTIRRALQKKWHISTRWVWRLSWAEGNGSTWASNAPAYPSLTSDNKATEVLRVQQQIRKTQRKHKMVCFRPGSLTPELTKEPEHEAQQRYQRWCGQHG